MPRWTNGSVEQEAFALHRMISEVYLHLERVHLELERTGKPEAERKISVLGHEIDDGVDLVLIFDGFSRPLQLKSTYGSKTKSWKVAPSLLFPREHDEPSSELDRPPGPGTSGTDGAFIVQVLVEAPNYPFIEVWYQMTNLHVLHLRGSDARIRDFFTTCTGYPTGMAMQAAMTRGPVEVPGPPKKLEVKRSDLTPPVTIGELLWLLFGIEALSDLPAAAGLNPLSLLGRSTITLAQETFKRFEMQASSRWRAQTKPTRSKKAAVG